MSPDQREVLDQILTSIRYTRNHAGRLPKSREVSLAITKLDEAEHWIERLAKPVEKPETRCKGCSVGCDECRTGWRYR